MGGKVITPEIGEYIKANYRGVSQRSMQKVLEAVFGVRMSRTPIQDFYKANNLKSGLDGKFKKGYAPANKGKKGVKYKSPESAERHRSTMFRPGNVPWNGRTPVGTIRVRKNRARAQYLFEKIGQPNKWKQHHVVVWERAYGKVPEGSMVVFIDGDTMNCSLDNLMLETKAQHAIKNCHHVRGHDRETQEASNTWADLVMLIHAKRKEK